jgi:hypothetical protein
MLAVVAGVGGVVAGAHERDRREAPSMGAIVSDPEVAAVRARDLALGSPLVVTLVVGGAEVARAQVVGDRADLAVGGLAGVQEGDRLTALGTTVEVGAFDPVVLLAPLVERSARWEGGHLRLEGEPPAQAWLDPDGRLVSLEVELGGGGRMVVAPAP